MYPSSGVLNGASVTQVTSPKLLPDGDLDWKHHTDDVLLLSCQKYLLSYKAAVIIYPQRQRSVYIIPYSARSLYIVSLCGQSTWPLSYINYQYLEISLSDGYSMWKNLTQKIVLTSLDIVKFSSVHKYFTLLLVFNTFGHNSVFKFRENTRRSRSHHVNSSLPVFRIPLFRQSIINDGPESLNSLPQDIKLLLRDSNYNEYKEEIKKMSCVETWIHHSVATKQVQK